jgi:6-pyruvoyltetrahydropterin/6-carboxytetrahydropterin synthase
MTITRRFEWDMAHRLANHGGLCRNIHGHRYAAEVTLSGSIRSAGPSEGMVCDFIQIGAAVRPILEAWDHALMLAHEDPWVPILRGLGTKIILVPVAPTAEVIARSFGDFAAIAIEGVAELVSVRVWETPTSCATYYPNRKNRHELSNRS